MSDVRLNAASVRSNRYWDAAAVTPADGADLAKKPTAAVFVGGAGAMVVTMASGNDVTLTGIVAGTIFDGLCVDRIKATGTTATNIAALYDY